MDLDLAREAARGALGLGVGCSEEQAASAQPGPTDHRRAPIHSGMNAHGTSCLWSLLPLWVRGGPPTTASGPLPGDSRPGPPTVRFRIRFGLLLLFPCPPFFFWCSNREMHQSTLQVGLAMCAFDQQAAAVAMCAFRKNFGGRKKKISTEKIFVGFEPALSANQGTIPTAAPPMHQ